MILQKVPLSFPFMQINLIVYVFLNLLFLMPSESITEYREYYKLRVIQC